MSSTTETMTIHLPASAARRLRRVAEISGRPVDDVIADTLHAHLPALLEDIPEAFRDDLAGLERLPSDRLRQELRRQIDPKVLARYDVLLAANAAGTLDDIGRAELAMLRTQADLLMFQKAYAALLLKWRGERVPSLAELESASQ
jgi:hypothetical protein